MRPVLTMLLMCTASAISAQTWRMDAKPLVEIGSSDMSGSELLKVSSGRRLPDGRIVVTNGDPREVRVFAKDGKLLAQFGKAGAGPGEFSYAITLLPAGGDSILVWDVGHRRRLLYRADGTLLNEVTDPTATGIATPMALVRRTLARTRPHDANSCVLQAIAAIPPVPPASIRELFIDEVGRVWTRDNGALSWALHTVAGKSLGTIILPRGLEILQAGKDFVLGRTTDDDGFDHVQLLHASLPALPATRSRCVAPAQDTLPVSKVAAAALKTDMRNGMTAFEAYHAKHGVYPSSLAQLDELHYKMSEPTDADFVITMAGAGSFVFGLFDRKSTYACVVAVGDGIPTGWINGTLTCGW